MSPNSHVQDPINKQDEEILRHGNKCLEDYGLLLNSEVPIVDPVSGETFCPPFWDTLFCWPPQLANTTSSNPCPNYIIGFKPEFNATRQCTEEGKWVLKDDTYFTNYSNCYDKKMVTIFTNISESDETDSIVAADFVNLITILSESGYAISLVSLIVALSIMLQITKLHCARNILHMNLFASYILRYFMQILKDVLFENGLALRKDMLDLAGKKYFRVDTRNNNFECKLLVTLVEFFTLANFSWVLMEGLYLNHLIFRALFTDSNKNLAYYIACGWGLPVLVIIPYVIARVLIADSYCWTLNTNAAVFYILTIPPYISVLVNLVLFVIISVLLYRKVKNPVVNKDSRRYLKWAKSTLILMPLFGVNYGVLLLIYMMGETLIWMTLDRVTASYQGFLVALLYCFLNGEVKTELKPRLTTMLIFLATNKLTKWCFPRRQHFLRSVVGRQSVCTSFSSLHNSGLVARSGKTKTDKLTRSKLTKLHGEFIPRHVGGTGHYAPNLTLVHGHGQVKQNSIDNKTHPPNFEEEFSMLDPQP